MHRWGIGVHAYLTGIDSIPHNTQPNAMRHQKEACEDWHSCHLDAWLRQSVRPIDRHVPTGVQPSG